MHEPLALEMAKGERVGTDPISLKFLADIQHPVIIRSEPEHVYEYEALTQWLRDHGVSPITGMPFGLNDIEPIRYPGFRGYHATEALLGQAWRPAVRVDALGAPEIDAGANMPNPFYPNNNRAYGEFWDGEHAMLVSDAATDTRHN